MRGKSFYNRYHTKRKLQKRIIGGRHFTYRFILSSIKKFARGKNYLDIGCGVGTIDFYLAKIGVEVNGIDISTNAISVASENARLLGLDKKLTFKVMDFPEQFPRKKYDFIICSEVLEHISNDKLAANRIYRLLKRNGRVLVTVPSKNSQLYKLGFAKRHDKKAGHVRRYTVESLSEVLEHAGLKLIHTEINEGSLREAMFMYGIGSWVVRISNKVDLVGDVLVFLDNLFVKVMGGSHIYMVAERK